MILKDSVVWVDFGKVKKLNYTSYQNNLFFYNNHSIR